VFYSKQQVLICKQVAPLGYFDSLCRPWLLQKMPLPGVGSDVIFMMSSCSVNHVKIFCFLKTFLQERSPNVT